MSDSCFCCWNASNFDQTVCQACGLKSQTVPDIFQISDRYKAVYNNLKPKNNSDNRELVTLVERALLLVKLNYDIPTPMLEKIVELNS